MERTMSSEERIRRAQEIYQRRKRKNDIKVSSSRVNVNNKVEYKLFKKLVLQILICLLIYFIFYLIKNSNYIFSEDLLNKTRQFLSYDINFQNVYEQMEEYYQNNIKTFIDKKMQEEEKEEKNETIENQEIQEEGGVGGGEEGVNLMQEESEENSADEQQMDKEEPLSQMQIDANDIKANYSLIVPLKGTITSRFRTKNANRSCFCESCRNRYCSEGRNCIYSIYAGNGNRSILRR